MPIPVIFRTRSVSNNGRYARLSPPASPRAVPAAGPQIGNLEDAVGALERWCATGDKGRESDRAGGNGWRVWVARAPLILAFSILALTYVPFVVWVGHDQLFTIHGQSLRYTALLLAYHTLLFLTILSLSWASTIPPGTPYSSYAHPSHRGKEADEGVEDDDLPLSSFKNSSTLPSQESITSSYPPTISAPSSSMVSQIERADRLLRRWCKECQGWKPPRCHHCRTCGICVLRMDHHCVWLNTCIGYGNHKAFLLFLFYATALSGLVVEETGYVIYKWLDGGQVVDITDFRPVANLMLFIVAVTFVLSIGSFACFHVYLTTNNRTTLENIRPSLPPAALIESGPAIPPTSPTCVSSPIPAADRPSSPDLVACDPPPAYSPKRTRQLLPGSPSLAARSNRLQQLQQTDASRSAASRRVVEPTSPTRSHWQWRWKPDHLLTRNERKLVRHVARNVNIYDRGDAWQNFLAVLEVDAGIDGNRLKEGEVDREGDVESGFSNGQRRMSIGRRRSVRMWFGRMAVWLWPTAIRNTIASSSATAHVLPGHSFPISTSAIETIRYKTYGLRTRRRIAKKPRAVDIPDGSRNLDHASDGEDGFVRSSNEFEFDSEEGYEVDEMEEYGMI